MSDLTMPDSPFLLAEIAWISPDDSEVREYYGCDSKAEAEMLMIDKESKHGHQFSYEIIDNRIVNSDCKDGEK